MTTAATIKERPIIFSAPMVRAILDGRKTQTRRIIKVVGQCVDSQGRELDCITDADGLPSALEYAPHNWELSPYGVAGDRLWVKERWWAVELTGCGIGNPFLVFDDEIVGREPMPKVERPLGHVRRYGRKSPVHMPKKYARITLELTDVRVERLNAISEDDAIAEGAQCAGVPAFVTNRGAFAKLWESINGPGSWEANPWVWAISFRKI